ncbi:MAG TPA: citrate synthase [Stellaceae bacterium]|nr:citrate synthase [Stellaceae bacterium]
MDSGLEGVVVAETVLSHSDGARGLLWLRGHRLEEVVAEYGYEGAVALLWEGFAGDGLSRAALRTALGEARRAAFARRDEWLPAAASRPLVAGVRMALEFLPEDSAPAMILGALPVAVAALLRRQRGAAPLPPDPAQGTAADLLRMIRGAPAPAATAEALDTYFAAVLENGLNTSAFAARIIASSGASLLAAVIGAYCAFSGPRHGGAPGPTLDMLDEIAASGDIDGWIEKRLAAGERLMGFGHRVFRHGDPRAAALKAALERLGPEIGPGAGRLAVAAEVERRVKSAFARLKPGRPVLEPNVEINAALLLDAVEIPRAAFTPVFAVARCAGWLAHAMEQQKTGRLIRPISAYIGPRPDGA